MQHYDTAPGTFTLADSDLFRSIGESRGIVTPQRVSPTMNIGRPVNLQSKDRDAMITKVAWHESLDELGRRNYGKGKALALGTMVLTHVTGVEMGRMLSRRNPKLYDDRTDNRGILREYRSLSGKFQTYARNQDKKMAEQQRGAVLDPEQRGDYEILARAWGVGAFAVAENPENFGKCDLSVVFEDEDDSLLRTELSDTWKFLDNEGYDTSIVDKTRAPHLSVYDAFHPLSVVATSRVMFPNTIDLLAPQIFISSNDSINPR